MSYAQPFLFCSAFVYKDEETQLVHGVLSHDEKCFEQLVKKYEKLVYNVAYEICRNETDAYDISQETFIKIYKKIASFNGDSKLSVWIYRIAENTAKDYIRSESRRFTDSLTVTQEDDSEDYQFDIADTDESVNPASVAEKEELKKAVHKAIETLSEQQRNVIIMREFEDLSYEDIAEALDMELGTVKSCLSRARQNIKKYLIERNFF